MGCVFRQSTISPFVVVLAILQFFEEITQQSQLARLESYNLSSEISNSNIHDHLWSVRCKSDPSSISFPFVC